MSRSRSKHFTCATPVTEVTWLTVVKRRQIDSSRLVRRQRQTADEVSSIDFQAVGNLDDSLQPKTALTALYLSELRPVDAAPHCCGLLAKSKRCATIADPRAELAGGLVKGWLGWVVGHEGNHIRPARNRPERYARMCFIRMRNRPNYC